MFVISQTRLLIQVDMAVKEKLSVLLKIGLLKFEVFQVGLRMIFVVYLKSKELDKNWTGNCNAGTADRVHWPCVPHTNNLIHITN